MSKLIKVLPSVLQLMGSFVLAVGLWLRFDPETVSLLNGDKAPDTFFIGEYHSTPQLISTNSVGVQGSGFKVFYSLFVDKPTVQIHWNSCAGSQSQQGVLYNTQHKAGVESITGFM